MCTAISLQTKKGFVSGRTMESPTPGSYEYFTTLVLPRGFCVPNAQKQSIENKYAIIGSSHYGLYSLCDGVNEYGLSGSVNLFPHLAKYPKEATKDISFAPQDLFSFILGNAKDCQEAKDILKKTEMLEIEFEPTNSVLPLHIALFDKEGGFIVIEPSEKGLKIYENQTRVMTNAPDYEWHIKNLSNYLHLDAKNRKESIFNGISAFGQGSGSIGLPGDFTPASRFIRAAFFLSTSPLFENSQDGVRQALRILRQFDIPFGSVVEKNALEITHYTAVMDNTTLKYYLNHYREFEIQSFDLNEFLDVKEPIILKKMS